MMERIACAEAPAALALSYEIGEGERAGGLRFLYLSFGARAEGSSTTR
jgi:hypothetical protein